MYGRISKIRPFFVLIPCNPVFIVIENLTFYFVYLKYKILNN